MFGEDRSRNVVNTCKAVWSLLELHSPKVFILTHFPHAPKSDIVHQSVYELVHSEDREELQRQLMWNSFLPQDSSGLQLQDALHPDQSHLLERSFTVRFRCLLDNTSGFLRLDIRGRIKVLHGQNRKTEEPPLALFALCTPFGPPSLLEIPHKEVMFKSKHKLDLSLVSMDQRGKMLLGYSDSELADIGGYDLVHYDDLAYVASAHQELLKTGASGMIAYRYQSKEGQWQWLQTSSRLVYKNSKPDFVISTHRPLMEEEGRDLLGKRTMDFKVSYLDAGLTNSYFSDSELVGSTGTTSTSTQSSTPQRVNRRYKTQLRDFLSSCRTKRKLSSHTPVVAPPDTPEFIVPDSAAAVAAAYSNLNMYGSSYPTTAPPDSYISHSGNFHQSLYDNRFLTSTTDNLFHQYRPLGTYYPDYHASTSPYVSNGFLEMAPRNAATCLPTYETGHSVHQLGKTDCDKLYGCHQPLEQKYATVIDNSRYSKCLDVTSYSVGPGLQSVVAVPLCDIPHKKSVKSMDNLSSSNSAGSSPAGGGVNGLVTPKVEEGMLQHYSPGGPPSEPPRQTVLMWGSGAAHTPTSSSSRSPQGGSPSYQEKKFGDPLKSLAEMNNLAETKWKPETPPHVQSPKYSHYQYSEHGQEVWPHQIYPYHQSAVAGGDCGYPQISRTGVLCCPSLR
ncbi:aryl hydrocarbon receptor spineless isoform X3 [Rhodnius prolixus]|uniref:aryl hydrocarbon receptor spineless isoform X3 n=1 Tax=Rhodnius prolixus TaxID=13249 RepID=UPI003D18F585